LLAALRSSGLEAARIGEVESGHGIAVDV
jgi:hypothetical protein